MGHLTKYGLHMGAFTNDVIILGGRGFGKDDARWQGEGVRRCWANYDVTFFETI